MDNLSDKCVIYKLDVEKVLYDKNPSLAKRMPRFIINYLKKVTHQEELNDFLKNWGHLHNDSFIEAGLNNFNIRSKLYGEENIPKSGRFFFVSNHPLGGLDGLVFIHELSRYFSDLKFPVNDILTNIKNLSEVFLPINKHGSQGKEAARMLEKAYTSDSQILYFPAGICSRRHRGKIADLDWHKSFITKAIQNKRDVVPAYISGRNSGFFYSLANLRKFMGIKANFEMLYLADEMFKQRGNIISLVIGKKIPWQTFDKSKSPSEWAAYVKEKSYELKSILPV